MLSGALYPPIRDASTIARLSARYDLDRVVKIAMGMDPTTATDIEAWRRVGARK